MAESASEVIKPKRGRPPMGTEAKKRIALRIDSAVLKLLDETADQISKEVVRTTGNPKDAIGRCGFTQSVLESSRAARKWADVLKATGK